MENYKEKYEQALERAKVINLGTADYEVAVKIFPELKENEDERIKEALMLHIKYKVSAISGWRKKELIAWLEKQGEQKPTWSEEDEKMLAANSTKSISPKAVNASTANAADSTNPTTEKPISRPPFSTLPDNPL